MVPGVSRINTCLLPQVFESRWVLVEGFSDYPAGEDLLRNASSSVMEADKIRNNTKTILFIERNIV